MTACSQSEKGACRTAGSSWLHHLPGWGWGRVLYGRLSGVGGQGLGWGGEGSRPVPPAPRWALGCRITNAKFLRNPGKRNGRGGLVDTTARTPHLSLQLLPPRPVMPSEMAFQLEVPCFATRRRSAASCGHREGGTRRLGQWWPHGRGKGRRVWLKMSKRCLHKCSTRDCTVMYLCIRPFFVHVLWCSSPGRLPRSGQFFSYSFCYRIICTYQPGAPWSRQL